MDKNGKNISNGQGITNHGCLVLPGSLTLSANDLMNSIETSFCSATVVPSVAVSQAVAMVVISVLGDDLRWADGVSCDKEGGQVKPKVGRWAAVGDEDMAWLEGRCSM